MSFSVEGGRFQVFGSASGDPEGGTLNIERTNYQGFAYKINVEPGRRDGYDASGGLVRIQIWASDGGVGTALINVDIEPSGST